MKKTMTTCEIASELRNFYSDNASLALTRYLESYEDATGEELEFDPVTFRGEFEEYKSAREALKDTLGKETNTEEEALEALENETVVITFDGGVIIQAF